MRVGRFRMTNMCLGDWLNSGSDSRYCEEHARAFRIDIALLLVTLSATVSGQRGNRVCLSNRSSGVCDPCRHLYRSVE